MKFTVTDRYTFRWPVKVKVPDQARPGQVNTQQFVMEFEALPSTTAAELDAERNALATDEERAGFDIEFLVRVSRDWDESVVDEDGKPVPFTPDRLRDLLRQWGFVRLAVYRAYVEGMSGGEARLGN
ncbi:MAG: hypothetical protein GC202_14265 [Alphaproteobacteria bacterium]|nr:hypothetical protein [Alphaproteobacteria bacterium]